MSRQPNASPKLNLTKRGSVYYVQWWEGGAAHRKSLGTQDPETAHQLLADMQRSAPDLQNAAAAWKANQRTTSRGLISETRILLRLLELGAEVFVPWGHDHKADLVAISGSIVRRIQVKSVYGSRNAQLIRAVSIIYRQGRGLPKTVLPEFADILAAYCPRSDECYAVTVTGKQEYPLSEARVIRSLFDVFG